MNLRLVGCLLCTVVAPLAMAEAFGRFGYTDTWSVPAMVLDKQGFKVDYGASDKFQFTRPLTLWRPISTTAFTQIVTTAPFAGSPSKLRHELTAPGFSAYFELGIDLKVASLKTPFITWPDGEKAASMDGSVPYPTPEVKWALISFRDEQPPILLAFPYKNCSLQIKGKTGDWHITSDRNWTGWMRVVAPTGTLPRRTNDAHELGTLVQDIQKAEAFWSQAPPVLMGLKVEDDEASVTAEWTFDKPGAVLPDPLTLAPFASYPLTVQTKTRRVNALVNGGPLVVSDEAKIRVRFPARRIPTGRILAVGAPSQTIGTASYLDPNGVTELAFANLFSPAERGMREMAESTFAEFLSNAAYQKEPFTGQQLTYGVDGKSLDVTAAQALLMQSTISVSRASSEGNSLLTSVVWRRDWLSWRIWCDNSDISRRTAALGAIAAALAPEPERRLDGAMLEAGLRSEQGLRIWRRRNNLEPGPPLLEALETVRSDIYLPEDYRRVSGLGKILLGDLRSYGAIPIVLGAEQGGLYLSMSFAEKKPEIITLASSFPLEVESPAVGAEVTVSQGFGLTVMNVNPASTGAVKVRIKVPAWVKLPNMPAEIRYEETKK